MQCAGGPRSSCATDASTSGARSLAPRAFSLTHGLPPWDPSLYGPHTFTQAGDPSQRLRTRATARPAPGASARVHGVIDSGASARALSGRWADDTKIITTSRDRRIFRRRKLRATRVSALQLHGSNARTFGDFDFFDSVASWCSLFRPPTGPWTPYYRWTTLTIAPIPRPGRRGDRAARWSTPGGCAGAADATGRAGAAVGRRLGARVPNMASMGSPREGSQAAVPIPLAPVAMVWRVPNGISFRIGPNT